MWWQVFFPFLELVTKVPERELAEDVLQFVGTLHALPFQDTHQHSPHAHARTTHLRQAGGIAGQA
jgi:hypothetical protein